MSYKETIKAFSQSVRKIELNESFDSNMTELYHGLLTRGFQDLVSSCFPVLSSIMGEEWHTLTKQIFQKEKLDNPYYTTLALTVVNHLKKQSIEAYPYAYELAHYEWIELELQVGYLPSEQHNTDKKCDLMNSILSLSNHARLLRYNYPVHMIAIDNIPSQKSDYCLFAFLLDGDVRFIELNNLTYLLLDHLVNSDDTANQMIKTLMQLNNKFNFDEMKMQLQPLLEGLCFSGALQPVKV